MIGTELKIRHAIIGLLCMCGTYLPAQGWDWWPLAINDTVLCTDTIEYGVYTSALASSGLEAPFLLRANRNANISRAPYSGNFSAGIYKRPTSSFRWWDYDFGVQLTGRVDSAGVTGYFEQLYAHSRLYVVDITLGIRPMIYGSQSRTLTMGGLLFSGNAHPIPRVSVGIDDYIAFPGLYGYLEIKGGLTFGFLNDHSVVEKAKLHHKFVGLRLGGRLPVTLAYEMHHAAQWGGYRDTVDYGNTFADFYNVFLFRSGGITMSDQMNAQGNHIGFQELALTFKHNGWMARAYWQSLFEDMSARFIGFGTNSRDGLWGLNIRQDSWPYINELTLEFMNTTHQSGPMHDRDGLVFAGVDSYYRNSAYPQGWSYYGSIIGTPYMQIDNNRVRAYFVGVGGDIYGYKYRMMASHVQNHGRYIAPLPSQNTALLLEVTRRFEKAWGLEFTAALAGDIGTQYGNSFGGYLRIAKTGIITKY